jgi:hypothetical protein
LLHLYKSPMTHSSFNLLSDEDASILQKDL